MLDEQRHCLKDGSSFTRLSESLDVFQIASELIFLRKAIIRKENGITP